MQIIICSSENPEQQPKENVTVLTSSTKTNVVIRRGAVWENLRSSSCCACSVVTAWPVRAFSKCTYACLGSVSHIPFSSINWKNHSTIRTCSGNIRCNLYAFFTSVSSILMKHLLSKNHNETISINSQLQKAKHQFQTTAPYTHTHPPFPPPPTHTHNTCMHAPMETHTRTKCWLSNF